MPYLATDWKDRAVDSPMTYIMQDNGDGTITLVPAEGNIAETGTPLTAANLNNMEDGISAALRTDEVGNMNGFEIQNVRIKLPANIYAGAGGGFNANNSDLMGLNNMYFSDAMTSKSEGMQWPRSTTPVGSVDYNDYDTLRVYNGALTLNDEVIGSAGNHTLWTGGYYLTSTQKITPSKKLSACANGWVLIWGDYDPDTQSTNDYDFVFTFIPKNAFALTNNKWHQAIMAGYGTATTVTINAKQYSYTDTQIWGNDINNSPNAGNNNQDVVLRWVVEV